MINNKIESIIFDEGKIKELLIKMNELIIKLENTDNIKHQMDVIDEINKLRDHYLTLYWCSYIGYLKDIEDKKYLNSEKIFGKVEAQYNNLVYKYYECLDKLKDNKDLIRILGERTFALARNQSMLLNKENNDLFLREKELCQEYRKLIIGTKFNFNGEEMNLSQLNKYLKDNDREIRQAAYDKKFEILISLGDNFNKIIDELVQIRHKIACNLKFNNYKEYGFVKMNRIDYNEEDLNMFKKNVIKYIVPLTKKLTDNQKERLELNNIDYYDVGYLFKDGNATPKVNLTELIAIYKNIYQDINKEIYQLFCDMINNGLIDLKNSENKSNGGITTYLPDFKYPMFIKKYLGIEDNITSINHEMGHSFQLYYSKDLMYHENRWPTFDICEIHSTTNELLLYPYMDKIFKSDVNKYYLRHLTNLLDIIIRTCAIDDFQCQLYENPNLTATERNSIWKSIYKHYYPTNNYGHKYYEMGIMWQADTNRVIDPFYGIDYALATICAFSFYEKELANKKQALEEYLKLCKDGGSLSLKELITKYKMYSPFKEEDIKNLSIFIDKEIDKYTLKLKKNL